MSWQRWAWAGWAALWLGCASAQEDPATCGEAAPCAAGEACVEGACVPRTRDASRPPVTRDAGRADALPTGDGGRSDQRPPLDGGGADLGPADGAVDAAGDAGPDAAPAPDGGADAAAEACEPGRVEDCGRTVGRCRAGRRQCGPDGAWGPCMGEVPPEPEVCNGADDDCNGTVDDGFQVGTACDGVGACGPGVVECASPVATRCSTEAGGSVAQDRAEACDGADNDCDGRLDEGFDLGRACEGACGAGTLECGGDGFARCSTAPGASEGEVREETCDGRDEDCDGQADEGFGVGGACEGVGRCGAGVIECAAGGARCSTDVGGSADSSEAERCNGLDDDCDGAVDEGFGVGVACDGPGLCGAGLQECAADGSLRCDTGPGGSRSEVAAERCDGADNDCDGRSDEGLGVGDACPAVGVCAAGRLACSPDGGTLCDTGPGGARDQSGPERCNGRDDDCDGAVDEALDAGEICGGDVCDADAPILTLGAARTGDTEGLGNDLPGSTCVPDAGGPDQVLRLSVPAAGQYVVGVAPLDGHDPVFWVGQTCATLGQCVGSLGSGRVGPGRPKVRRGQLAQGTVTVAVDTRGAGGRYVVAAAPFAAGETCASALTMPVPGSQVGTLDGRANDHAAQRCPAGVLSTGADQAFAFDLAAAATVRVQVVPDSSWMPTVYLTSNCAAVDNACAGAGRAASPGETVAFSADLAAGTWYVVVERPSAQQAGGEFRLDLSVE